MRDYINRRETMTAAEEALAMHKYYEDRILVLMMYSADNDSRINALIERAEKSSKYWLDKYNSAIVLG